MSKYKVGDRVWYAKCKYERVDVLCPTCFGKKEVTLILGNGDHVVLPCDGCASGCNPPSGYVHEYEYVVGPEPVVISGMNTEVYGDRETARYRSGYYAYVEEDLFLEEDEAKAVAEVKKKALDEEQSTKAEYIKANVHKKFSWNANYHMREAKRDRRSAEHHEKMARLCKERARDGAKEGDSE